eukprot:1120616-Amphidinium_carterae.1
MLQSFGLAQPPLHLLVHSSSRLQGPPLTGSSPDAKTTRVDGVSNCLEPRWLRTSRLWHSSREDATVALEPRRFSFAATDAASSSAFVGAKINLPSRHVQSAC